MQESAGKFFGEDGSSYLCAVDARRVISPLEDHGEKLAKPWESCSHDQPTVLGRFDLAGEGVSIEHVQARHGMALQAYLFWKRIQNDVHLYEGKDVLQNAAEDEVPARTSGES